MPKRYHDHTKCKNWERFLDNKTRKLIRGMPQDINTQVWQNLKAVLCLYPPLYAGGAAATPGRPQGCWMTFGRISSDNPEVGSGIESVLILVLALL